MCWPATLRGQGSLARASGGQSVVVSLLTVVGGQEKADRTGLDPSSATTAIVLLDPEESWKVKLRTATLSRVTLY